MIHMGAIKHPSQPSEASRLGREDFGLLVAWWFVIAACLTGFDLVSSRADYVPLHASVLDHCWQAMLCAGAIGALYAEQRKLLWFVLSAVGELIALAAMVLAVTFLSGLLAA